jgi:signal transduction histidine kinase
MSHELRTPLNAILGFASLMIDEIVGPVSPQHKEYLGDILTSGKHLLQLVNDVLDLAKIEAGKLEFHPERVDLARTIGEVASILRPTAASENIRVKAEVEAALGMMMIDPARLKQILYNYLSNALKFTREGGTVTVRAMSNGPAMIRLEVEDSGIGLAPEDISRLFVEFEQLASGGSNKYGGTGLGLALTKRLVEAQGGVVGVRSTLGKGSVFHAILPREAREQARPAA